MSIQSTIKETEDNFGQQFADYGGEYSSNIDAPRSMLLEYIKTSQLNLLKAVVKSIKARKLDCDKCDANTSGNEFLDDLSTDLETIINELK